MPKSKTVIPFILRYLDNHSPIFPLFRHLLEL
jgi:hypothetical protein